MDRPTYVERKSGRKKDDWPAKDEAAAKLKQLAAFLADWEYSDGTPRETGTLLICFSDGRLKAMLKDREEGMTCWVSAETLQELFEHANQAAGGKHGDWRREKEWKPTSGQKKGGRG